MPHLIRANSEIEAFKNILTLITEKGFKSSRYLEVENCLVSIKYSESNLKKFIHYKSSFLKIVGKTAESCFKRADRVYTNNKDRMTKPSYFKRMNDFDEILNGRNIAINQIENIIYELSNKPKHSLLSFTIFRPADLINKKRPGYVPCPIAGDFKFRKGELSLNMFFRSNDALNFFYPDIYYLRKLQELVLLKAKLITKHKDLKKGQIGTLNIYFSRIYLPLRMEMVKKEYINGAELKKKTTNLMIDLEKYLKV